MSLNSKDIAEYFDSKACDHCEGYREAGLSRSSKVLMNYLVEEGLTGKTVLDLGCGMGAFAIETLKNGAASCVGVDLSSAMIKTASELAMVSGFHDRAKFEVRDVAAAKQPASDVVVMDKVICCYPEVGPLLKNALEACQSIFGFIVPRDEGVVKGPLRLGIYIGNLVERLRRRRVRMYLHPLRLIDRVLRESGFVLKEKRGSRFWLVFLYERPGTRFSDSSS